MNLEQSLGGTANTVKFDLRRARTTYLVRRFNRIVFTTKFQQGDHELGQITLGFGGAKLQAVEKLYILPGHSRAPLNALVATDPRGDKYELEPASDGHSEIIVLRHGDVITAPNAIDSVRCTWQAPEVQVNSSAELVHDETSGEKNGVDETPEDETEDEAAPGNTITEVPVTQPITQPTKSQPSATPHLPTHHSVLVQETPTTQRMVGMAEYEVALSNEDRHVMPTPPPQGAIGITETSSIAHTGQSPKSIAHDSIDVEPATDRKLPQSLPEVRASGRRTRKCPSPAATEEPTAKRMKNVASIKDARGDTMQPRPLDDINADPLRTIYSAKGKKRFQEITETTPTKSSRSSQRSATATTVAAYEGEPPRVATSNSAIKDGSLTVKFLRKHGGTLVASVEDKCNVLCVRDGGLAKTMKVIQAVALGVPIVTDKWLVESARAEGFLDLSSFKPSVTQQEKEWGFNFEKVWGVAQTPFKGYAVYFTPTLKKTYTNFREMDRVCQTVGAKVTAKRTGKNDKVIVLATEEGDPDAEKMIEDGEICYHKDLLTTSILRGTLDLDSDEFKIKARHAGPLRRKGPRKST
ncbi:hypothetical protein BU25DRAFT_36159 [Macroventuria anomochaeta]|uniref:Uncharacterized protein n=1 Tax=Macroventuria anomochaeta TaxID=301207 RepID=A0ACB6S3C9_9PLEO|nr:uncharacterized protein BU25DRAFT_36159 [Macroventuria anomochaeta]KAF2628453.1 hypothetical protein BU25DRAFT_36159 [Macroventuria anomochaeta]